MLEIKTHVEDHNSIKHSANSFCDVTAWAFSFGGGAIERLDEHQFNSPFTLTLRDIHSDELHSLERESGLDKDRQNAKETINSNVVRHETSGCESTRVFPILNKSIERGIGL